MRTLRLVDALSSTEPCDVSVVIPAYKAAGTIRRAVASVLAQTRPPMEILVVDDGSPDWELTADELDSFEGLGAALTRLRKDNGGVASARNLGVERATRRWVAFLDADDYWEPTKLEKQLMAAAAHSESTVIGSTWWEDSPEWGRRQGAVDLELCGRPLRHPEDNAFFTALSMWTGTVMVQRVALTGLRFESSLEPAEDRDVWCNLATRHTVYLVGEPLAIYVHSALSLSNSNVDRDCRSMLRVIKRHADVLGAKGVRRQRAVVYRRWASGHLSRAQFRRALAPAVQRLRIQPLSVEAWRIALQSATMSLFHWRPSERR